MKVEEGAVMLGADDTYIIGLPKLASQCLHKHKEKFAEAEIKLQFQLQL